MIRLVPPILTAGAVAAVGFAECAADSRMIRPEIEPDPLCTPPEPGEPPAPGCPEPVAETPPSAR
ncbi:MAG: hypothetical protein ABL308_06675 [Oceanicaulis sp.]